MPEPIEKASKEVLISCICDLDELADPNSLKNLKREDLEDCLSKLMQSELNQES